MWLAYEEENSKEYHVYMSLEILKLSSKSDFELKSTWDNRSFQVFLDTFLQNSRKQQPTRPPTEARFFELMFRLLSRYIKTLHLCLTLPQWLDFCHLYQHQSSITTLVNPMRPFLFSNLETFQSELSDMIQEVKEQKPAADIDIFVSDTLSTLVAAARVVPEWWYAVATTDLWCQWLVVYNTMNNSRIRYDLLLLFNICYEYETDFDVLTHRLEILLQQDEASGLMSDWNHVFHITDCMLHKFAETADGTRIEYLLLILNQLPTRQPQTAAAAVGGLPGPPPVKEKDDKIQRVKDIFAELEDEYIQKCIEKFDNNVEKTIDALLEKNGKLDPEQVWIGKKPAIETKADQHEFQQIQRQVMLQYDQQTEEEEDVYREDEYNDDYNDEFDDYIPFGVNDNPATDLEETKIQNNFLLAKEAEDAFWNDMRNRNRMIIEEEPKAEEEEKTPVMKVEPTLRQRAYRGKNKAKFGNHNRKNRATKKRS